MLLKSELTHYYINMSINERIKALRAFMTKQGIDAFIVPSSDPHNSEYVSNHWQCREWISGFSGSAGTAIITSTQAGLWTDSRYFLQAENQLNGSEFMLFKEKLPETPTMDQWLSTVLKPGDKIGFDGWVNSADVTDNFKECQQKGITLNSVPDPFKEIWTNRPPIPENKIFIHSEDFAGESCSSKLQRIKNATLHETNDCFVLSALDDIAWALNLRGSDIHCNPVFISYLVFQTHAVTLYINKVKLSDEIIEYLKVNNIEIKEYDEIEKDIEQHMGTITPTAGLNYTLTKAIEKKGHNIKEYKIKNPVPLMKCIKNETEIIGFRHAMEKDGVAMVKFLMWLDNNIEGQTELSIDHKLTQLRAKQPLYKGISFDTIAGYGAHAAIVHYEPTPETDIPLQPRGMLLLDSGAQYLDGTTDITRTISLGFITEEEKRDYTLVLKGHLQIQNVVFPEGTCGTQLDILARQAMWREGINYLHGTGHGVGQFLCVHEGPHQIRMNHMPTLLKPGMTVTDEPGIYKVGRHGVRIENTLLVVPAKETEFGHFYQFEPLTLCPIDKKPIILEMLTDDELRWLNQYHEFVYNRLHPFLNTEEKAWLKNATLPLTR